MNEIKLVVFDCDGVMFDSREANREYYNRIRLHFGRPPMDEEELDYVHMHQVNDSLRYLFRDGLVDPAAVDRYRSELDYRPFLRYMRMEPDLPEFLDYLRPRRKTAISTNRTTTMPMVLSLFNLTACFDLVVTALDVTNPKPHPEALVRIMADLGVGADQTIYIGDSRVDFDHARAAGVALIAFKNPGLAAQYHVGSFMEIVDLPPFKEDRL